MRKPTRFYTYQVMGGWVINVNGTVLNRPDFGGTYLFRTRRTAQRICQLLRLAK